MTHDPALEDEQLELPFTDLDAVVGGALTKVGAGTLTFSGANTYAGVTAGPQIVAA